MKISTRLYMGFGVLLVILIASVAVSYYNSDTIIDSTERIIHTEEVIVELEETIRHLVDAETGQRGYLFTGEERYLEPYNDSLENTGKTVANLRELTRDNPLQQENINVLEQLIEKKLAELKETIDLRRAGDIEGAREIVLGDEGKNTMDAMRALIAGMIAEEERLLEERSQKPGESREATNSILSILLVLGIVIGGGIAFFISKSISKPIEKLKKTVDAITTGKLDVQLEKSSISEVQSLTDSLDRVLASMKLAILRTGIKKEEIAIGKTIKSKEKEQKEN